MRVYELLHVRTRCSSALVGVSRCVCVRAYILLTTCSVQNSHPDSSRTNVALKAFSQPFLRLYFVSSFLSFLVIRISLSLIIWLFVRRLPLFLLFSFSFRSRPPLCVYGFFSFFYIYFSEYSEERLVNACPPHSRALPLICSPLRFISNFLPRLISFFLKYILILLQFSPQ